MLSRVDWVALSPLTRVWLENFSTGNPFTIAISVLIQKHRQNAKMALKFCLNPVVFGVRLWNGMDCLGWHLAVARLFMVGVMDWLGWPHWLSTFTFTHLQDSYYDISRDCVVNGMALQKVEKAGFWFTQANWREGSFPVHYWIWRHTQYVMNILYFHLSDLAFQR